MLGHLDKDLGDARGRRGSAGRDLRTAAGAGWRRPGAWLAQAAEAETERWPLFLAPVFGTGIGLYFALPMEPPAGLGFGLLAVALLGGWLGRRRRAWILLFLGLAALALGFALAQARSRAVAAPVLEAPHTSAMVTGQIERVEALSRGWRVILRAPWVSGLEKAATPEKLRLALGLGESDLEPGQWIRVEAELFPPPPPVAPGAFDYPRQAYFQRLGAVGFALDRVQLVPRPVGADDGGLATRGRLRLNRIRHAVSLRILRILPGAAGGMAAAMMTGERSYVPETVQAEMRDAGLAHLLAIAGLHLSLVAGGLFFVVRFLIAAWPGLALAIDAKKWAAAAALFGAFLYLLMSGAAVSTERAFVMTAAVLVAILLERRAISLHLVAFAAAVILALAPESLLQAGFQMSFAAVLALVAAYEAWGGVFARWHRGAGPFRRILLHLAAIAFTSLIAGLATAPFALYHFDRFVTYGLLGNILAVPITAFWVMPWAIVSFLLMPFHLERLGLLPMGFGIHAVIRIAHWVSSLKGDAMLVPQMPMTGLVALTMGGLWLCLWRRRWRFLGLAAVALGLLSIPLKPRPDVLIAGRGGVVALRQSDGRLAISPGPGRNMAAASWLERDGEAEAAPWPKTGASADGSLRCDRLGCLYRRRGVTVALVAAEAALPADCRIADVIVSRTPLSGHCASARLTIDGEALARNGAYALFIGKRGEIETETAAGDRGRRPWTGSSGAGK